VSIVAEQVSSTLEKYVPLLGSAEIEELRALAGPLEGATVSMVNSTAVGGGVAEILIRLLPLMREVGLDPRWEVIEGGPEFYEVTKSFHNALHGQATKLGPHDFEIFREYNRRNRERLALDTRFVVIHDPQPAGLIESRTQNDPRKWIWRCHIDLSHADLTVWKFLEPYVVRHDGAIFSSPEFSAARYACESWLWTAWRLIDLRCCFRRR